MKDPEPLVIGGRKFARFREVPVASKPPRIPWVAGAVSIVLLGLFVGAGLLAKQRATVGDTRTITWLAIGTVTVLGLSYFALVIALIVSRRTGVAVPDVEEIPKPDGSWQLVKARVFVYGQSYSEVGWLKVGGSSVEFNGKRFGFSVTSSDWIKVSRVEGWTMVRFKKLDRVPAFILKFYVYHQRDGRVFQDPVATKSLLAALEKVNPSGRPSILPPIEPPPLQPLKFPSMVRVGVVGYAAGLLLSGATLLLGTQQKPNSLPPLLMLFFMPFVLALAVILIYASPTLTAGSWKKEIEKLKAKGSQ